MHIEYITLVISAIAIIFSGFSLMYTRKIAILNQSEQERNDHVELNITIENLYESQVCFENISLRRILYLQSIEYNGLEQNLGNIVLGVGREQCVTIAFRDQDNKIIKLGENMNLTIFFQDDLGRKFNKVCDTYVSEEI